MILPVAILWHDPTILSDSSYKILTYSTVQDVSVAASQGNQHADHLQPPRECPKLALSVTRSQT